MTMVGKGGGNFYVVILSLANIPIYEAATTGQFILFMASVAGMLIFQKKKSISWALVMLIGSSTALSALMGGYFSHCFSGFSLKLIFAVMLSIAGIVMLIPVSDVNTMIKNRSFRTIKIRISNNIYNIDLWIAITALMGFTGHAVNGDFNPYQAIPLVITAVSGGILGGKFALKTKPRRLKHLFAYTNWLAALFMVVNAFHTNEIV